MKAFLGISAVLLLIVSSSQAQNDGNFEVGINTGIASGWWIYTLGTGAGIDRTDNQPKISVEAEVLFKPNKLGVALGLGYSWLLDNTMEAFEDTRAQRSKYLVAEKSVQFWQYYLQTEYDVYQSPSYTLTPQVRLGGFSIDTIHPEKDNFDAQFYFELGVLNQLALSDKFQLGLRAFYQSMKISVKEENLPGEEHRIFSLGVAAGIRYRI